MKRAHKRAHAIIWPVLVLVLAAILSFAVLNPAKPLPHQNDWPAGLTSEEAE